jgi:hypothetical protein
VAEPNLSYDVVDTVQYLLRNTADARTRDMVERYYLRHETEPTIAVAHSVRGPCVSRILKQWRAWARAKLEAKGETW